MGTGKGLISSLVHTLFNVILVRFRGKVWEVIRNPIVGRFTLMSESCVSALSVDIVVTLKSRPHVPVFSGRVEVFENGDLSFSCGRAKTEVFKYDVFLLKFAMIKI